MLILKGNQIGLITKDEGGKIQFGLYLQKSNSAKEEDLVRLGGFISRSGQWDVCAIAIKTLEEQGWRIDSSMWGDRPWWLCATILYHEGGIKPPSYFFNFFDMINKMII